LRKKQLSASIDASKLTQEPVVATQKGHVGPKPGWGVKSARSKKKKAMQLGGILPAREEGGPIESQAE